MLLSMPVTFRKSNTKEGGRSGSAGATGQARHAGPAFPRNQRPENGRRVHYERRRPEDTALYQLVQEHLETFLAQVELETGAGLPEFVKKEFDAFLDCGILARGSGVTD